MTRISATAYQASTGNVHPTALVSSRAKIGKGVSVGPYCVIGDDVVLGDDVQLKSHVVIEGNTQIHDRCVIHPFAVIGSVPQDLKYQGEASSVIIGSGTVIREHVTIHAGTIQGGMVTQIGRDCLLMVGVHIAHDCRVGNHVVMANNATLAGHVTVGDGAVLGGLCGVHQWVSIGCYAMIGFSSRCVFDVIPYGVVSSDDACLKGLNWVGIKRLDVTTEERKAMKTAYQRLFKDGVTVEVAAKKLLAEVEPDSKVHQMVSFIMAERKRGLCLVHVD